jgi:hypothetical protein
VLGRLLGAAGRKMVSLLAIRCKKLGGLLLSMPSPFMEPSEVVDEVKGSLPLACVVVSMVVLTDVFLKLSKRNMNEEERERKKERGTFCFLYLSPTQKKKLIFSNSASGIFIFLGMRQL